MLNHKVFLNFCLGMLSKNEQAYMHNFFDECLLGAYLDQKRPLKILYEDIKEFLIDDIQQNPGLVLTALVALIGYTLENVGITEELLNDIEDLADEDDEF